MNDVVAATDIPKVPVALGPELVQALFKTALGAGTSAPAERTIPAELAQAMAQNAIQSRQFLERIILEQRAEIASLRSELAAARQ